ncbi:hypothetical protein OFY05_07170 [Pseudocitrobacter faecalis]|nr:hypothetical protein OFY05_07170 [Pseudocitrobacter faecalis]
MRPTAEGSDNVLRRALGGFNVSNNTQLGLTFTYGDGQPIGVELAGGNAVPPQSRHRPDRDHRHRAPACRQRLTAQWYFGGCQQQTAPVHRGRYQLRLTFFDGDSDMTPVKRPGCQTCSLEDSWGAAGQVGLDYLINRDWLLNMSVWYMDIDTDVKFKARRRATRTSVPVSTRGCLCSLPVIGSNGLQGWSFATSPAELRILTISSPSSLQHKQRVISRLHAAARPATDQTIGQ